MFLYSCLCTCIHVFNPIFRNIFGNPHAFCNAFNLIYINNVNFLISPMLWFSEIWTYNCNYILTLFACLTIALSVYVWVHWQYTNFREFRTSSVERDFLNPQMNLQWINHRDLAFIQPWFKNQRMFFFCIAQREKIIAQKYPLLQDCLTMWELIFQKIEFNEFCNLYTLLYVK